MTHSGLPEIHSERPLFDLRWAKARSEIIGPHVGGTSHTAELLNAPDISPDADSQAMGVGPDAHSELSSGGVPGEPK